MEKTLAIIKPDAVAAAQIGTIISAVELGGLAIVGVKMLQLTKQEAEGFYRVHRERPFFAALTSFMSEGPVVVLALQGENAIVRWREMMGATDPAQAAEGTLRKALGSNIERNAVHGSDSPASAAFEVSYFFSGLEVR